MSDYLEFIRALNELLTFPVIIFLGIVLFFVSLVVVKVYQRAELEYTFASIKVRGWMREREDQARLARMRKTLAEAKPIVPRPSASPLIFPQGRLSADLPITPSQPGVVRLSKSLPPVHSGGRPPVSSPLEQRMQEEEEETRRQRLRTEGDEIARRELFFPNYDGGASDYLFNGSYSGFR